MKPGMKSFAAAGILFLAAFSPWGVAGWHCDPAETAPEVNHRCCRSLVARAQAPEPQGAPPMSPVAMPKPGEKVWAGSEYYFIYEFDRTPKLGPAVIKVQLFNREGARVSTLEVKGEADMPSMRGMHSTGPQPFKLNKKGDYLLPITLVMPGEWEIIISLLREGKEIYAGSYRFRI